MEEVDIVVIGGGSGGSAAAGRLSEDGKYSVCVLEAGGRNDGIKTRMPGMMPFQKEGANWRFETEPQAGLNGRRGYQPRGRGLGGSSAINAMLYLRGHPGDYDEWRDLGCPGWDWDAVLPYFKRAEHNVRGADAYHGADGPLWVSNQNYAHGGAQAFIDAAANLQIPRNDDFNGPRQEGVGLYQVTQRNGERWSAARAYLDGARPNLSVITDAMVEKLEFDGKRASAVRYRRNGESKRIRARRAIILAAGAFQTPQMLMLSGIGPAEHLRAHGIDVLVDHPEVGGGLQDHIDYVAAFETQGSFFMGKSLAGTFQSLREIGRWVVNRRGRMTTPYAEAGGFVHTLLSDGRPDIQFHFVVAIVEDHGRASVPGHGFSCHACVLRPESRGTVRLRNADPFSAPLIDPAFLSADKDLAVLRHGVRDMYRILETAPMRDYLARDRYPVDLADDAALDAMIRARADTVYHPVGTARMGSDESAVVDPELRVNGVDGLYISDASIMPRLVGGNTNAPSIMIGERCADFVRSHLQ